MVSFSANDIITGDTISVPNFLPRISLCYQKCLTGLFFCTQCFGKVPAALSTYSISEKHTTLDNRLSTELNELKQELTANFKMSQHSYVLTSECKALKPEFIASTTECR